MKKFRISMIILLLVGVLAAGIGAGTAFVELSALEYADQVWIGGGETEVKQLMYRMQDQTVDRLCIYTGSYLKEKPEVIEDVKIPRDEVIIEVTYNSAYCEPMIENFGVYENGEIRQEDIQVWTYLKQQDSFKLFMDIKDRILEELKKNRVSSYQMTAISDIKIFVHPINADKLLIN